MKKIIILAVVLTSISFVSCKKDRICTCTSGSLATTVTYLKVTKRQAKNNCISSTTTSGSFSSTTNCDLK